MGVTLIKYLESISAHRGLYYMDDGESDLPLLRDLTTIDVGSIAECPKTGQQWYLNSRREWYPIKDTNCCSCCGNNTESEKDVGIPKVISVTLTPSSIEVAPGERIKFVAKVDGSNLTTEDVTWSFVKSGSIDKNTTISQDGYVKVSDAQKKTKIQVQAVSKDDLTTTGIATIQITPGFIAEPEIKGITISPKTLSQAIGEVVQFRADVSGIGSYNPEVNWELVGATDSLISTTGQISIGLNETAQAIIVRAVSKENPLISDTAALVITKKESTILKPEKIEIIPKDVSIQLNTTLFCSAKIDGAKAMSSEVIWEIVSDVSSGTYLTADGILHIDKNETATAITIQATCCQNPVVYDTATFVIESVQDPGTSEVTSVTFIEKYSRIQKGGSAHFAAVVNGKNLKDTGVTWSIEGNTTTFTKISEVGVVTVSTDEQAISLIVVAASKENPLIKEITVVVIDPIGGRPAEEEEVYVPEVDRLPFDTFYVRGVDEYGHLTWKKIDDFIEDAPSDVPGAKYIRTTKAVGENIWELFTGGDGIPTMTKEQWNALAKEDRPALCHIDETWYKPIKTYITDENGYLY